MRRTRFLVAALSGGWLGCMACGGNMAAAPAATAAPEAAGVSITANAATPDIGPSGATAISAVVANDSASDGVSFNLAPGAPGALIQKGPLQATYYSPLSLDQAQTVEVAVQSRADASKSVVVPVNLHPISITVADSDTAPLGPSQSTQLTATTSYDGGAGVVWSLASNAQGTLTPTASSAAAYTAPSDIAQAATATIVATSSADPSKTASVPVALAPPPPPPPPGTPAAANAWENLSQFENGLEREGARVPPYAAMELDPSLQPTNSYAKPNVFQSNLLIFHDTATGAEVWRLDDDPTAETAMPGPINRQPWDANGSHFEVWSNREVPQNSYHSMRNFVFSANASQVSLVQPTDPTRVGYRQNQLGIASGQYLPWDPNTPGRFYIPTAQDTQQAAPAPNPNSSLYAIEANDSNFTMTKVTDLPNPGIKKKIQSYPANDGMLLIQDENAACADSSQEGTPASPCVAGATYVPSIYMVATNPADPTHGKVKYQFPINFGLSRFSAAGHNVANEFHFHDIYFRRSADDSFIFNYGPLGDVGEPVFFEAPVNGDASKIKILSSSLGNPPGAVGGTPYYSHPAWNFDGSLVGYYGEKNFNGNNGPYGVWIRNQDSGTTLGEIATSFGHSAWDGFDPSYFAFDVEGKVDAASGLESEGLYSANPTAFGSAPRLLVREQPRNPALSAPLLEGPAQSPDATKVMFTLPEKWLKGSPRNVFIAVDHRPFPPALKAASGGGGILLSWTPYLTHREIAGYHVYRSPKGATAFREISSGLVAGTSFTDSTAAAGQAYDYAVTAQENSGLESNQLSNIEEVAADGAVSQRQAAGMTGWMTQAPAPPSGFSAAENSSQQYIRLSWTASPSSDVRYYKIYYGDGSAPQATQNYLIATPPAGVTQWIVWQADPGAPAVFGLSAVDRQDNESAMVCLTAGATSAASAGCPAR